MANASIGKRQVSRLQQRLRATIGSQIVDLRTEGGLTQRQVATAVEVDPGHLSRIERGMVAPSLDLLVAIAASLGADLGLRLFPNAGPRLVDRFQASMQEALIRRLDRRWRTTPELSVPSARGVIDPVLRDPAANLAVACESQSELRRLEQVLRRAGEKADALAERMAGAEVSRLLLLRSTLATRDIARRYEATLGSAYPARAADAIAALFGNASWPGPAIVWVRLEAGRAEVLDRPPRGVGLGR